MSRKGWGRRAWAEKLFLSLSLFRFLVLLVSKIYDPQYVGELTWKLHVGFGTVDCEADCHLLWIGKNGAINSLFIIIIMCSKKGARAKIQYRRLKRIETDEKHKSHRSGASLGFCAVFTFLYIQRYPFTPKSDQFQISLQSFPHQPHHTVEELSFS